MSPVITAIRLSSGSGNAEGALSNSTSSSISRRSSRLSATRRPRKPHPPVIPIRIVRPPSGPAMPLTPALSPRAGRGRDPRSGRVRGGERWADHPRRSASDAVALGPAKAGHRLPLRAVFAADPAGITQLVEEIEQELVVDLPDIGLVPAGIAGDLDMRIVPGERSDAMSEVALHDLHMIEIEL